MLDTNAGRSPLIPRVIFVEGRDENTNVAVEVALSYNDSYNEHIYSYVNNINTIEGGTHVSGFRRALTRVFKQYGEKENFFEKAKIEIEGDDFREGLSAIFQLAWEPNLKDKLKQSCTIGSDGCGGYNSIKSIGGLSGRKPTRSKEYHPESNILKPKVKSQAHVKPVNWYNVKVY